MLRQNAYTRVTKYYKYIAGTQYVGWVTHKGSPWQRTQPALLRFFVKIQVATNAKIRLSSIAKLIISSWSPKAVQKNIYNLGLSLQSTEPNKRANTYTHIKGGELFTERADGSLFRGS